MENPAFHAKRRVLQASPKKSEFGALDKNYKLCYNDYKYLFKTKSGVNKNANTQL